MATNTESRGDGNVGIGGYGAGARRRRKFWNCGGNHLKRNCLKLRKERQKKPNTESGVFNKPSRSAPMGSGM